MVAQTTSAARARAPSAISGLRRCQLLAALALAGALAAWPSPGGAGEARKILVLHSYHHDYPWTDQIQEGLARSIYAAFPDAVLHVEFMNTKRRDPAHLAEQLLALYGKAYAGVAFDVIVASDNNALDFLLKHRDQLFPGAPVVFCGINNVGDYRFEPSAGYTGVGEVPDIASTIEVALRLHPGTRKLAVISDNTETGEINLELTRRAAAQFPGLQLLELRRLTAQQLAGRLGALEADTVVLNVSFIRDAEGRTFTPRASMAFVVQASPRPVYTCWDYNMAPGALGGKMLGGRLQGERAGELAVRVLRGEPAGSIPVVDGPTAYLFDDAGLRRFGVDPARLPPGAEVTGRPDTFYTRYQAWVWAGAGLFAVQGSIIGLLLWNIARRRREESARLEMETRYQGIVRNASEGIFEGSLDGRILAANPAMARILGFDSPEQAVASLAAEPVPVYADPAERTRLMTRVSEQGWVVNEEMALQRRDGGRIWVLVSGRLVPGSESRPPHIEGSVVDITERKAAETEALASRLFMETLLNAIPVPVFYKDAAGRYLGFNQAFEEFFGLSRAELVGRTAHDLSPPHLAEEYHARDLEVLSGDAVQVYESQVVTARGSVRDVIFHKAPFRDADGKAAGLIGVILDITDRRRAEESNQKLQQRLVQAQKMESVGRLAGGVAHDYNNMLAVIFMELELIKAQLPADGPLGGFVEGIEQAARRSRDITQQLLAFSRKQIVAPRPVDLDVAVSGLLQSLGRLIGEDVEIRTCLGAGPRRVLIDPSQVDQILVNLVVNSRDAMPAGGVVTIETAGMELDAAFFADQPDCQAGTYVRLSVADTGSGMDRHALQHIFEPFFTTKATGKGTGLGLATVFGIVKQNRGAIEVQSEPGKGTRFAIYLPCLPEGVAAAAEPPEPAAPGGNESILLVEDDAMLARATGGILGSLGYRVTSVATGEEALAQLGRGDLHFDLTLTDVIMPGMNGAELRTRIQAAHPGARVMFMSGYAADVIAERGVLAQDVDFIQKPFTLASLSRKVRQVLDRRGAQPPHQPLEATGTARAGPGDRG